MQTFSIKHSKEKGNFFRLPSSKLFSWESVQLCLSVFKRFDYSLPSFEAVSEAAWHALIAGRHLWANGMQDEILQTWEEAGEGCVSWERRVAFLLERNHLFFQLEHHPRRAPWWLEEKASCSMPAAQSAAGNVAAPLRGNAEGRAWKTPCDFQISFKSLRLEKRKKWKFSLQLIWEAGVGRPLIRVSVPIPLAPSLLFLLCVKSQMSHLQRQPLVAAAGEPSAGREQRAALTCSVQGGVFLPALSETLSDIISTLYCLWKRHSRWVAW